MDSAVLYTARRSELWAIAEARHRAEAVPAQHRRFRWVLDVIVPLTLTVLVGVAVLLPVSLTHQARVSLFAFGLAIILWATTTLNAAYVALVATLLLVLGRGAPQEALFEALASDVVWLMIGAFVLGEAVHRSGLAARLTEFVVTRTRTVTGMCWLLTTALIPLSWVIPSTSGRAAVMMPVFRTLARAAGDTHVARALALLIPTIILVATISTLVGAGSHLIANDLLYQVAKVRLSFAEWALYGIPFGVAASYASCWVIMRLFLDRARRTRPLCLPHQSPGLFKRSEWTTVLVALLMMSLWVSESWHHLEVATVSVVGAAILTCPAVGVMRWKDGLKAVSWDLIIFVGAALVLGRAMVESGAAQAVVDQMIALSGMSSTSNRLLVLLALAFISLTSHLYMTSHTARAMALTPPLLYLATVTGVRLEAIMFIGIVGMDYCLTFPVSSKALLMFQGMDEETFQPTDLLRLSAVLLLVHLGLIIIFYYGYWRWVGLSL